MRNFYNSDLWPIYVISLPDAVERRVAITTQFQSLSLGFSFLDAVDGRQGLPMQCESEIDRAGTISRYGYPMSDAEYACALSHQRAYSTLLNNDMPGAIIFEDDIILTQRFKEFYLRRGYEAAPLVQFFYFNATTWRFRGKQAQGIQLARLSESAWMTAAYSISAKAARKMHAESLPLRSRADWPLDTANQIGHYITIPRLAFHPEPTIEQSMIGLNRQNLIPEGFDFSASYAKGWRRLLSFASWSRLIRRPFIRRIQCGYLPTVEESREVAPLV